MSRSRRACLARLLEMDSALARMERELPADVVSIGRDARRKVALWRNRLASGEALHLGPWDVRVLLERPRKKDDEEGRPLA